MSVGLRINFDEYTQMVEGGAFDALRDKRIELIHGQLRSMTPPGPDHSGAVDWFTKWSVLSPPLDAVTVRIQNPVAIPALDCAPQPDVVWAKPRVYRDRHPLPEDVLLLIEISDSSLEYDCGEKAEVYAAAEIRDYWVVNLQDRLIHVFRNPLRGVYGERRDIRFGE